MLSESAMPTTRGPGAVSAVLPDAAVLAQAQKIVASRCFAAAGRLQHFLQFVVERTLKGEAAEVKEYCIGVHVFGRPPHTYNPAIDPIVRVQARRLRDKLQRYYETEGRRDDVILEIPLGSYIPGFRARRPLAPSSLQDRSSPDLVNRLAILRFIAIGGEGSLTAFCHGLAEEVMMSLSEVSSVRLVARTSISAVDQRPQDLRRVARRVGIDCFLEGSVREATGQLRIAMRLIGGADGCQFWSSCFECGLQESFSTQTAVAHDICRQVEDALQARA